MFLLKDLDYGDSGAELLDIRSNLVGFDSQNRDLKKLYENENRVSFGVHNLEIDSKDGNAKEVKKHELKIEDSPRKQIRQPSMFS